MALNCFLKQVQRPSPRYGIKVGYSKWACSTRLSGNSGEARVIRMLEVSNFDALEMVSPFIGGIADRLCDHLCETISHVFTSYAYLLSMVIRRNERARLD